MISIRLNESNNISFQGRLLIAFKDNIYKDKLNKHNVFIDFSTVPLETGYNGMMCVSYHQDLSNYRFNPTLVILVTVTANYVNSADVSILIRTPLNKDNEEVIKIDKPLPYSYRDYITKTIEDIYQLYNIDWNWDIGQSMQVVKYTTTY